VARSPQAAPAWWGRVDEVGATSAVVRVQAPPDEPPPEVWVGRAFDAGTFRRQDAALARAAHLDTPLVQVLCGGRRAGRTPLDRDPDLAGLDAAQADAVRAALEADTLALIHGPPGTGKTTFARRYAKLLYLTGQVQNDVFVETRAMELKGNVIGESKTNTLAALKNTG
jgi:DNA replication ATP-dependent helicase Dna2